MLIILALLISAAVSSLFTYLWVRRPRPVIPTKQRLLLDDAMILLRRMITPTSVDEFDTLSEKSRKSIDRLLERYYKENK